jgi:hypothetical protein
MSTIQVRRLSGARKLTVLALLALTALFAGHLATADASPSAAQGCPSGALCLYKHANFNSTAKKRTPDAIYRKCQVVNLKGWTSRHGSYLDNQTGSPTTALFAGYGGSGKVLRAFTPWTGNGSSSGYDNDYDFYPVNSIRVC